MEIVNWFEHEEKSRWNQPNLVAYALIEAMSAVNDGSLTCFEKNGEFKPKALEVEFKVNGVAISFVGVMDSIQKAVESIESDCRKVMTKEAAQQIITHLESKYRTFE